MNTSQQNIAIVKVFEDDVQIVASLAKEIWQEYFTPIIGADQVAYMLENFQSEHAIREQLEQGFYYFLASVDNVPMAYIAFMAEEERVFISKLYVKAQWRGRGLGKQLFSIAKNFALVKKKSKLYLTVNKHNSLAIQTYEAMGFETIADVVKDIGGGFVMDDYVMELETAVS